MKKTLLFVFTAFALTAVLVSYSGCSKKPVKPPVITVTGVSLSKTTLSLTVGGKETLTVTINPADATNKSVTWSSDNTAVVTVNATTGEVTAVAAGTAKITVTSADGSKVATCTVTITIDVSGVTLNKTTASLTVGAKETLVATVAPTTATNKTITWSSDNTAIATVNSSTGEVTAVAAGTAKITATTVSGSKTASCTVTVTAATVAVTGVTLNKTAISLVAGTKETLTATVAPTNATTKTVTWSSDNTAIATVNSSTGEVTAVAVGSAKITATTVSGSKTASCTVAVTAATVAVTGVTLNKTTTSLTVGAKETLTATVAPTNATNKTVTWSSDNTAIATVNSSTGEVTAVAVGSAKITATTVSGGKTASCIVTVIIEVSGVTLNKTAISLPVGTKETLVATVAPSNATNKDVIWTSDRPGEVDVDRNTGEVTAVSPGARVNITAITVDGRKTASCEVTVTYLDVSLTSLNFAAVGERKDVRIITGGTTAWTASSNAAWLTLDRTSGNSSYYLTLTAAATTADQPRTATVTIRAGGITRTVAITQETNIIRITNSAQLYEIKYNPSGHYSLRSNITVSNWTPIGRDIGGWDGLFTGTFDGNGYTITISSFAPATLNGWYSYGLFDHIRNGKVSRLHVAINAGAVSHTNGEIRYGGIAGTIDTTDGDGSIIENCSVSGNLVAAGSNTYVTYIGGIGGYVSMTTIRNCLTSGSISVTGTYSGLVGGIAGRFGGEMRACVAMQSSINDNSNFNTGGINRVVGTINGTPVMANYANSNMLVRGSRVTSSTGEVTQHGADCTTATTGPTGWGGLTFWQGTLGWDNTIWDFSGISSLSYPTLRRN